MAVDQAYNDRIMQAYNESVARRPADQASANAAIAKEKAANPAAWGVGQPNPNDSIYGIQDVGKANSGITNNSGDLGKTLVDDSKKYSSGGQANAVAPQNNNSLIQSIYDSMYAAQSQKLKATRDTQLAGLAGRDDLANQSAQSSLNANDVTSARNSNAIREQLANLGLLKGGDYITRQTAENTSNEQNANMINQDRNNTLKNLAAQRDAINNNASSDDLALLQSIQASQGQAQLGQYNTDRSYDLQKSGQDFSQGMQTNQFDLQKQGQSFNQGLATNQDIRATQGQAFNQQQAIKQQHIDLADKLTQQFGVVVKPTDNPMESYAQVAGLSTVAAQKIAADAKQSTFDNAIKLALADNTITQTQASIMHQAQQIGISQQQANTSAASQSTSASNLAWAKDPNNPDNRYKEAQIKSLNEPKPKTTDYKTDPHFAQDIAHMQSNPNDVQKLNTNSKAFIDAYGYDGYLELRKASGIDK